jgi:hypothetical protein
MTCAFDHARSEDEKPRACAGAASMFPSFSTQVAGRYSCCQTRWGKRHGTNFARLVEVRSASAIGLEVRLFASEGLPALDRHVDVLLEQLVRYSLIATMRNSRHNLCWDFCQQDAGIVTASEIPFEQLGP